MCVCVCVGELRWDTEKQRRRRRQQQREVGREKRRSIQREASVSHTHDENVADVEAREAGVTFFRFLRQVLIQLWMEGRDRSVRTILRQIHFAESIFRGICDPWYPAH